MLLYFLFIRTFQRLNIEWPLCRIILATPQSIMHSLSPPLVVFGQWEDRETKNETLHCVPSPPSPALLNKKIPIQVPLLHLTRVWETHVRNMVLSILYTHWGWGDCYRLLQAHWIKNEHSWVSTIEMHATKTDPHVPKKRVHVSSYKRWKHALMTSICLLHFCSLGLGYSLSFMINRPCK